MMRAERRRPQRVVGQDDAGHHAEVDRQHHQREADAEQAVNPAGQEDLDEESGGRDPERESCRRNAVSRVGLAAALELLGGHVHLQIEDRGAQRAERDHDGNQLDLP